MKKKLVMAGIALPFVVLIIWILKGVFGRGASETPARKGLNTQLPGVLGNNDSSQDKLSFYAVAKMDSLKRREQLEMDPYRKEVMEEVEAGDEFEREIAAIQKKVSRPVAYDYLVHEVKEPLIQEKTEPVSEIDPEIAAINATLDKIAALQVPVESVRETDQKKLVEVEKGARETATYFGKKIATRSGFFGDGSPAAEPGQGIRAIIPYSQVVQPGSTVRVELRSPIQLKGMDVPAGTVLSGIAGLTNERLQIQIPSIRIGAQVFQVELTVFDMDGLEGIYVPGSISRDVMKASADGAVQSIGIGGFDASIKTQAVSAGVGAAKGLLSRKVKAVRVNLPAGYPVLLMRKNSVE
ncbi:MAG: conjugative transposon protein TraM [Sediminibacterium sp.]